MKSNNVEKSDKDYTLAEKGFRRKKKPKFDWAGGLEEFRDEYTSVELQEKAPDWIVESVLGKPTKKQKEPAKVLK